MCRRLLWKPNSAGRLLRPMQLQRQHWPLGAWELWFRHRRMPTMPWEHRRPPLWEVCWRFLRGCGDREELPWWVCGLLQLGPLLTTLWRLHSSRSHAQSLNHVRLFFDPMDCSPPGSSVRGISQARVLEWVASSSFRESSWPRDWTWVSCVGKWILYPWATGEASPSLYLPSNRARPGHLTPSALG